MEIIRRRRGTEFPLELTEGFYLIDGEVKQAPLTIRKAIAYDDFEREDGPLGVAPTGQNWIDASGSMSISGGKAVCTEHSGGVSFAAVPAPLEGTFVADITWRTGNAAFLTFRSDGTAANRLALAIPSNGNSVAIQRVLGGVNTNIASASFSAADGQTYRFKAVVRDGKIEGYVDDVKLVELPSFTFEPSGYAGLCAYRAANVPQITFDNFEVW